MTTQHHDLATLVTALYCIVDDLYLDEFASRKPIRPGPKPKISDSEVLTLMILAQWESHRSERSFLAHARTFLLPYFPHLPSQSSFNRRARDLMGVLSSMAEAIRQKAIAFFNLPTPAFEVIDGVPLPIMRRCRGGQHRLFTDEAAIGRGGSDKDWYYGLKLVGAIDANTFFSGFVAGPANTEERWLAEALFRWRVSLDLPAPSAEQMVEVLGPTHRAGGQRKGPSGPLGPRLAVGRQGHVPIIADLNYKGASWGQHWHQNYGARVLTEADFDDLQSKDQERADRWLHGLRQRVESAYSVLTTRFGLKFPRARTRLGLYARLGAKFAAYNLNLFLNHLFHRPPLSSLNPLT